MHFYDCCIIYFILYIQKISKKSNIILRKLGESNEQFISNYEFNKNTNPVIKNKFFNYLDIYRNCMIVLDIFLPRFKEYKSYIIIFENIFCETIKNNEMIMKYLL